MNYQKIKQEEYNRKVVVTDYNKLDNLKIMRIDKVEYIKEYKKLSDLYIKMEQIF